MKLTAPGRIRPPNRPGDPTTVIFTRHCFYTTQSFFIFPGCDFGARVSLKAGPLSIFSFKVSPAFSFLIIPTLWYTSCMDTMNQMEVLLPGKNLSLAKAGGSTATILGWLLWSITIPSPGLLRWCVSSPQALIFFYGGDKGQFHKKWSERSWVLNGIHN